MNRVQEEEDGGWRRSAAAALPPVQRDGSALLELGPAAEGAAVVHHRCGRGPQVTWLLSRAGGGGAACRLAATGPSPPENYTSQGALRRGTIRGTLSLFLPTETMYVTERGRVGWNFYYWPESPLKAGVAFRIGQRRGQ